MVMINGQVDGGFRKENLERALKRGYFNAMVFTANRISYVALMLMLGEVSTSSHCFSKLIHWPLCDN